MKPIVVTLSWPNPILSPNSRVHWRPKHKAFQAAKREAFYATMINKHHHIFSGPAKVHWTFYPPDRRRRDESNMLASTKAFEDGISMAIGVDDSQFRVSHSVAEPVPPHGRVEVEITSAEAMAA